MAILKPSPSSPMRFASGTSTSLMKIEPTSPARMPRRSWIGSVRSALPHASRSSMNAETPRWPALVSVLAKTSRKSAVSASETHTFCPLST